MREAPNPIAWCHALQRLEQKGRYSAAEVLKQWNSRSVRADQVTGGKYMTVKNLLELPDQARAHVLDAVSVLGWSGGILTHGCHA